MFAECIRSKLEEKSGIAFPPGNFRVFGFIDDKVVASARPGGGPRQPGEDAACCRCDGGQASRRRVTAGSGLCERRPGRRPLR